MHPALQVLQEWFNEERGNRVTTNNMQMLFNKIAEVVSPPQKDENGDIPPGKRDKE